MADNKSLIKKMLQDKKYVVKVSFSSSKEKSITLETPERKLKPEVIGVYVVYEFGEFSDGRTGIFYKSDIYNDFIKCPMYCVNSFIKADIDKICDILMYDKSMICYSVDQKEVDENTFYSRACKYNYSEEDLKKKKVIEEMLRDPEGCVDGSNEIITQSEYYEEAIEHIKNFFFTEE